MQDMMTDHGFPPWELMIGMDITIVTMAVVFTALFWRLYANIRRGRMLIGAILLLAAFWTIALTYLADLYTMLALPQQIGMAAAMAFMSRLHTETSWYLNSAALCLGVIGMSFVVTAFVHQMKMLNAALVDAENQSTQKATFFASMSHEFRTPLNAIIGFAGLIKDKQLDEDPALYHEYGKIIMNSGNMMLGLVNDLLDLARIEAGQLKLEFEKIDLRELVESTTQTLTQLAVEGGLSLNICLPDDLPPIDADRRALQQIVLNLVSNAIKFTPECGTVSVTVEWRDRGFDTENATLVISDTGIGMSPSLVARAFMPYVQGSTSGADGKRGSGLGLAVCQRLVDAHDGTIETTSSVGEGTTIQVALPTLLASKIRSERGSDHARYVTFSPDPAKPADELAA